MKLWIRSQNKEELTNPIYLQIIKVSNSTKYAIISCSEMAGDTTLGFYESKERALEILDDISNLLKPKAIIQTTDKEAAIGDLVGKPQLKEQIEIIPLNNIVYEMPEE